MKQNTDQEQGPREAQGPLPDQTEPADAAEVAAREPTTRARLGASLVLAVLLVAGAVVFGTDTALDALGGALVAALVGAQFEALTGETTAVAAMAVAAGAAGQWAYDRTFFAPWDVLEWRSYGFWPPVWALAAGTFVACMLLEPFCPHLPPSRAVRRRLAESSLLVGLVLWITLTTPDGPAAASLIVAIVVFAGIWLSSAQRLMTTLVLVFCVALAASALAEKGPPSGATAPYLAVAVRESNQMILLTRGDETAIPFAVEVDVSPNNPTPFGCPHQVGIEVTFQPTISHPYHSRQYRRAFAALVSSGFGITMGGKAHLDDPSNSRRLTVSHQRPSLAYPDGTTTVYGQHLAEHTGAIDEGTSIALQAPWESPKGTGSCFVSLPGEDQQMLPPGDAFAFEGPWQDDVSVPTQADLTSETYSPALHPDPLDPVHAPGVRCTDTLTGDSQCPSTVVITAHWQDAYAQIAILVVGALLAIGAERWFRSFEQRPSSS